MDNFLAGPTGFEPAIFSVTGRRDRPASLRAHNCGCPAKDSMDFSSFCPL